MWKTRLSAPACRQQPVLSLKSGSTNTQSRVQRKSYVSVLRASRAERHKRHKSVTRGRTLHCRHIANEKKSLKFDCVVEKKKLFQEDKEKIHRELSWGGVATHRRDWKRGGCHLAGVIRHTCLERGAKRRSGKLERIRARGSSNTSARDSARFQDFVPESFLHIATYLKVSPKEWRMKQISCSGSVNSLFIAS